MSIKNATFCRIPRATPNPLMRQLVFKKDPQLSRPFRTGWVLAPLLLQIASPVAALPVNPAAEALSTGCLGCHGSHGEGHGSIPALRTLSPEALTERFLAFRDDAHQDSVMHRIAKAYSEEDAHLVADVLARKK